jgi:hypothetical protein
MLLMWRNRFRDPFAMDHPAYRGNLVQVHRANNGLRWAQMAQFTQQLGLVPIPPLRRTPTVADLMELLLTYGPLYADGTALDDAGNFAGVGHAVVIGGARIRPRQEILIYDPWPVGRGRRYWRSAEFLTLMFARQIGNPSLPISILHLPASH